LHHRCSAAAGVNIGGIRHLGLGDNGIFA